MVTTTTESPPNRIRVYAAFFKLRLASLVVFSACLGYLFADYNSDRFWQEILCLSFGGFLITGASNGINQILERELDALMNRTRKRPLPTGGMHLIEAWSVSVLAGIIGIGLLYFGVNLISAVLGFVALISYAFIYTPLKQITSFAVFVGAFPGAVPPMLGWVAATGHFGPEAGILFAVQFMWQFPHFWAIAWVLDDDYSLGGFRLLPSSSGRDKSSAFQILIYSLFTIPVSLLPWAFGLTGTVSLIVASLSGIAFCYYAFKLYFSCEISDARKLMFASFFYLPILQLIYVLDKL